LVALNYEAATDLASGLAVSSATWTDIGTNQSFTLVNSNAQVRIDVSGSIFLGGSSGTATGSRIVIDSGGTPVNKQLGGNYVPGTVSDFPNALAGAGQILLTTLASGAHTVKVQVYGESAATTAFCRPSTHPNVESLRIIVLEG
jgi:hypothetical protein